MPRTFIKVQTQFEGIHCYPTAPSEVAFLRQPHRHMFHVIVKMEVFHTDRELEFLIVKRDLDIELNNMNHNMSISKSCEQMARYIYNYLNKRWPASTIETDERPTRDIRRCIAVEVSEDEENGAIYGDI